MNAPADVARIQRNRERKARRFVDYFVGQMRAAGVANPEADKPALEKAIAQVRAASREQWVKVADEIKDKPPSAETVLLIVAELQRKLADADAQAEYVKRQKIEDAELIEELFRQRSDPEIRAIVDGSVRRRGSR